MAKTLIGVVSSVAAQKTITVTVNEQKVHPLYHKRYSSSKKYLAHDEKSEAAIGDKVSIIETRPISRNKHFRLEKVVQVAPIRHVEIPEEAPKTEKAK